MTKVVTSGGRGGMYVLGPGGVTLTLSAMDDESCSEVSSSSPLTTPGAVSPQAFVSVGVEMSPPMTLALTDIGEVDLNFWDLDLNSHSPPHNAVASTTSMLSQRSVGAPSESSLSGREDMSSPSSYNGYGTESSDYKKKKGPVPRQQEELCLVCGDRASGYHYNALTCEGCKGFFRRSITKNAVYQCKYGHNCEMDMYMRRKCQECRLKKCLNVGMRPECVVPESQCQVKREQKKARGKEKKEYPPVGSPIAEEKFTAVSPCNTMGPSEQRTSTSTYYNKLYAGCISLNLSPVPQPIKPNMPVPPMTSDQEELISALVHYQEEFEQPSEADIKRIQFCFEGEASDMKFKEITEMTLLTVQLIVEFSKQLPGFSTLQQEDKISLLKACSSEVMMLRAARRYDAKTNSIVFGNSYPYTESEYETAGLGFSAPMLFRFCRNMCRMKVDNAEYALLAAMSIFSADRPFLREAYKVQKLQEIYLNALSAYVANKRAVNSFSVMIGKLLNVLTELRTLGNLNSEMCYRIQLTDKRLPDLLNEIWDVTPK
ncbi:ecdysone receptor-like isoform X2 [Penaeus japonicus]|uniref:ecdysone receptor-like isoform X2 n=1 Tax=Penaeus japonicus TaxID=27405 RepID=UPI001C71102F|nr:ecdysone receptor-like isoform X2 [Penaeus japonicus]